MKYCADADKPATLRLNSSRGILLSELLRGRHDFTLSEGACDALADELATFSVVFASIADELETGQRPTLEVVPAAEKAHGKGSWWVRLSPEERSARARHAALSGSPEERREKGRKGGLATAATRPIETKRTYAAKARAAKAEMVAAGIPLQSREQQSAAGKKGGRIGGLKGGPAQWANKTPEQREAHIARLNAARWKDVGPEGRKAIGQRLAAGRAAKRAEGSASAATPQLPLGGEGV